MAITDYDRQAVIWCAERAELREFYDRAEALTVKAANKAMARDHDLALSAAAMYPDMEEGATKDLAEMLGKLTAKSRLYICGHGGFGEAPKFVRWDAKTFVGLLKKHGLERAKLINLVSCQLGRDYSDELENYVLSPANSFAAQFHRELKDQKPALETEVRAYTWLSRVHRPGLKNLPSAIDNLPFGSKLMTDDELVDPPRRWAHKPKGYKISFYWEGGERHRRYMNKDRNSLID